MSARCVGERGVMFTAWHAELLSRMDQAGILTDDAGIAII